MIIQRNIDKFIICIVWEINFRDFKKKLIINMAKKLKKIDQQRKSHPLLNG